ncbi:hypothetical protein [Flavobacterium sp.]|uniref:hypothetical protein n=1 Tax=Flavobacterium sp. TaxID=239 RepID=UPI003D138A63
MKKIITVLVVLVYFTIIVLSRKYSDNHIVAFLTGISCAVAIAFFLYMIDNKKRYSKRE